MDSPAGHYEQHDNAPTDDESDHDIESDAWDSESLESDSDDEATKTQNVILLQAASDGDEETMQSALNEGARLVARDADGQTSLHLAILHNHESMVRLLLKKGADIEAATKYGSKPLYIAAEAGNLRLVDLLLQFRTDIESRNLVRKTTALYEAVCNEHLEVAQFLLDHGADIDAKDPNGFTPLFSAVSQGNLDLVEMLLQHGASKKVRLPDGRTVEDLASGDNEMRDRLLLDLLQEDQVLQGPTIAGSSSSSERPFVYIRPPPVDKDKLNACDGFKCTIVDFYLGDREQRIQVSPTIYEVLYGKGPSAVMDAARGTKMSGRRRAFRWYHFPANNIEWVEGLVTRIFAESRSGSSMFDEELKSDLGLTATASRQLRASTAHSSFMRPLCQSIKPHPKSSLGKCRVDPIMAFIPFLHFETFKGYEEMALVIEEVKIRILQERAALNLSGKILPTPRPRRVGKKQKKKRAPIVFTTLDNDDESLPSNNDTQKGFRGILQKAKYMKSTFRNFTNKLTKTQDHVHKLKEDLEAFNLDLETGAKKTKPGYAGRPKPDPDQNKSGSKPGPGPGENIKPEAQLEPVTDTKEEFHARSEDLLPTPTKQQPESDDIILVSVPPENAQDKVLPPPEKIGFQEPSKPVKKHEAQEDTIIVSGVINGNSQTVEEMVDPQNPSDRTTRQNQSKIRAREDDGASSKGSSRKPKRDLRDINENLIRGYLYAPKPGEIPALQLRRTLDQYFYTHLSNTGQRDSDQVVWRYTRDAGEEPLIFMVDQVWLWVLDEGTVISCYPQRWKPWSGRPQGPTQRRQSTSQPLQGGPPPPPTPARHTGIPPPPPPNWRPRPPPPPPAPNWRPRPPPPPGLKFPSHPHSGPTRPLDILQPIHAPNNSRWPRLDEETCLRILTTFTAFTIKRAAPPNPTENLSWARAEITQLTWPQETIIKHIKRLDENELPAMERKAALKPFQNGQINKLLHDLNTEEADLSFHNSFVQLDMIQRPTNVAGDRVKDSQHHGMATIIVYVKRAPRPYLDLQQLYWELEATNMQGNRLLAPIAEGDPAEPLPKPEPQSQHPKVKINSKHPSILAWMAGSKAAGASTDEKGLPSKISVLDKTDQHTPPDEKKPVSPEDPLDVHQKILNHLRGSARAPITSVYDMASLIANSCANVFDPYRIPDEFQFFDFFESSIGRLLDAEARCFKDFIDSSSQMKSGQDDDSVVNITQETAHLVEIRDIRDELSILKVVLNDQREKLEEFNFLITREGKFDTDDDKYSSTLSKRKNKVLENHLHRIEKMETLAKNTYKGFNHLLDLKQKQANVSEAVSARIQAKNTFKQTELSKDLAQKSLDQATETARQADETAKQGKTVLLFTVITIIFLPLSFMAAFFAINIDVYPVNENGKLSLGYVLKYMLSISGAVSIPFVFVAFNQDNIASWMKNRGKQSAVWAIILVALTVLLVVIWTGSLASSLKAVITVALVLLVLLGALGHGIFTLITVAAGRSKSIDLSVISD